MMTTDKCKGMAAVAAFGVVVGLTGCAVTQQPAAVSQQSRTTQPEAALQHKEFASVEDARRAVAGVVGCDDDPTTDPIINPDLADFTAEYLVCADHVQVVWFETGEARNAQLFLEVTKVISHDGVFVAVGFA